MRLIHLLACISFSLACCAAIAEDVHVIEGASEPHITVTPQGHICVVLNWKRNTAVVVSKDGGKTFTTPVVAIDSRGRASRELQRGPRISADAAGRLFVTGFARFNSTPDLFLTVSEDGGSQWAAPVKINDVDGSARHALHWMSVSSSGQVHVAWLDIRGGRQSVDLFYSNVSDGTVSQNMKIATNVCECCAPGLDVDEQGNPFIVFREGGDKESRELFFVHSTDMGKTFSDPMQLNQMPSLEDG